MASDAFAQYGISRAELERAVQADREVNDQLNNFMEDEVVPYARAAAGNVRSGEYAAGIKVTKKAKRGKGKVTATAWYSHFIEYGTGGDKDGPDTRRVYTERDGWVTLPKDTPTKALAPMQKTAKHFGGTTGYDGGITIERDDE